ncbi:MAG: mechanosensitive ion channel family protein [Candidatus Aenigmarchaeota archaeon]|nr:mechanosensitive ion channel family protein [Candidatus Aenigmarchaeota archaeon]
MVLDFLPYGSELFAGIIILVSVAIAKLFNLLLSRYVHRLAKRTESQLDDIALVAVQRPIFFGIVLGGIFIAVRYISLLAAYTAEISMGFSIIFTLYGLWFAIRVTNAVIEWYSTEISAKTKTQKDDQFLPIIKKVVMGVFGFIALLMVLGQFGIEITTLVAAMGLGGLAIALALQPTLSNFFSGAYLVMDRPIRIGDYIELDSGERGTVDDIGWRSTKLKIFGDNLLIIPNSKLADAKIINYFYPAKPYTFTVNLGVSYASDLDAVEKVTLQVAREVLKKQGTGRKDGEPFVRFKAFGDSNIDFSVYFQVKEFMDKFVLRHEFIKALKKRYDKEGIEIAWPTRKIFYGDAEVLRSFKK